VCSSDLDHTVISYVNTTAAVKAHTDVVVTSTNAKKIVDQFPAGAKLIFGPDRNLGNYINSVTGREMLQCYETSVQETILIIFEH
jgi:quinolinate synthase